MILQGDPRLILGPSGSSLQFTGGQPLMDQGLENLALISLFTSQGWVGNLLVKTPIGSDFEEKCNQPITRQSLNDIRNSAERALVNPAFGRVTVRVGNPSGYRLNIRIIIEPPGTNPQLLVLTRNGENWKFQASNPAYKHIGPIFVTGSPVQITGGAFNLQDIPFNLEDWDFNNVD